MVSSTLAREGMASYYDTISDEENVSTKDDNEQAAVFRSGRAVAFRHTSKTQQIQETRNFRNSLNEAIRCGDVQRVSQAISISRYSVNYDDPLFSKDPVPPPLILACEVGHLPIVRVLLMCKSIRIDIEHKSETPLSVAAKNGFTEIMNLLFAHGANANYQSLNKKPQSAKYYKKVPKYRSPLYQASDYCQYEAAALLLQNSANVNYGCDINSPLMAAARKGHVKLVELLLDNGAEVHPKPAAALCPLAYACKKGHTKCTKLLIIHGSDVDHESGSGTPLMCAAENGHTECAKLLLENGAEVNKSNTGVTHYTPPLSLASKNGHVQVVRLLLKSGANVNKKSRLGRTALDLARSENHCDIVELLLSHGAKAGLDMDKDKDDDEAKHLAAVELAMKKKSKLDHTLAHGVLAGPARSGKSSLMQRLTGEMPTSTSPSTGAVEQAIQVGTKKSCTLSLGVENCMWFKLLYDEETIRSMKLLSDTPRQTSIKDRTESIPSELKTASDANPQSQSVSASHSSHSFTTASNIDVPSDQQEHVRHFPAGYLTPTKVLKSAVQRKGLESLRERIENSWSLYLTDTGGQMEFQELLPLLVSGPSIFFIVFRLNHKLDQRFTIEYHLPDGEMSKPYLSTLTIEEAILQTLASIASMGSESFDYRGPHVKSVPLKPKVFIIGTHKDRLNQSTMDSDIKMIDRYLQRVIKSTSHYREDIVEFADENQLIFTVNNLSEVDTDFQKIRYAVERVVHRGQYQVSFPSHWLIFSLALRQEMVTDSIISYDQCFTIAQDCGITDHEELDHALWFLHTKLGLIRHFPTPGLHEIVIRHPQVLFDMVTKLIVNTFTFEKVSEHCSTEFEKKGIFNFADFSKTEQGLSLLPPKKLLELLEHLRILAPFQEGRQQRYFIPCVLSHSEETNVKPSQTSNIPPLLIVFKCGYVPKGLAGALIVCLLTNEMGSKFEWELMTDQIFRDQVTFGVSPYDIITLKIHSKYLEIIHSCLTISSRTQKIEDVCNKTRLLIERSIKEVSSDMNLTSSAKHSVSFYCQNPLCCPDEAHPATKIQKDENGLFCNLWCKRSGNFFHSYLPNKYSVWFGKQMEPEPPAGTTLGHLLSKLKGLCICVSTPPPDHTTTNIVDVADNILMEDDPSSTVEIERRIQAATMVAGPGGGQMSSVKNPQSYRQTVVRPVLRQAFHILLPLAAEWQSIGILLGIPNSDLRIIQLDNPHNTRNCLSNMLDKWLNCHDPLPTWSALAEAVEKFDPSLADIIRQRYLTPT